MVESDAFKGEHGAGTFKQPEVDSPAIWVGALSIRVVQGTAAFGVEVCGSSRDAV